MIARSCPDRPCANPWITALAVAAALLPLAPPAHALDAADPEEIQNRSIQVIETVPVEVPVNAAEVPDTWETWIAMIESAERTIEAGGFYFSNSPDSTFNNKGIKVATGRLEMVLRALEAAGSRGVSVRVLGDEGFFQTYPETLRRLARHAGIEARIVDYRAAAGGPMHAKYLVVDRSDAYVGSANWDWRALEHIHEIGVRVRMPAYAETVARIFGSDWLRGRGLKAQRLPDIPAVTSRPDKTGERFQWIQADGERATLHPAMSPQGDLPDDGTWDLPQILNMIDGAQTTLRATLLSYSVLSRDGTHWRELDDALRRAASRGVAVELMIADWSKRKPKVDDLKALQRVQGITVRFITVPEASTGFIPFARVTHAKYLTVDGTRCWVGTSNWEKSYFYNSRNVGLVAESPELTAALDRDFLTWWDSEYAADVNPDRDYEAPRVSN